ncbi:prolyl endopeptidase [Dunaliella salina]|uniref:Prolyl endopeptidase n=1 Tax=Dunaliella salina TaxID=3046 RepID=A0ABQ7GTJ8_DUNSA|nr:prolyl endopeptidase [Dunaliella salina]|eukprot:KAF5837923.1 prolyl endopeptidase [Dunaliella salina]
MTGASLSDDGRYVLLYVSEGCQPANRLFLVDTQELTERTPDGSIDWKAYDVNTGRKKLPVKKLVDNFDASYSYVANEGTTFYFKTNLKAPRYKYLRDVRGQLQLRSLSTGALQQEFELETVGSVTGVSGQRKESEFFFSFTSFVEPGATYRVDLSAPTGTKHVPALFKRTELKVPHNPADYETKQVFVPSKDGTRIPMFITHKKGLKLDSSLPTLLYGYGGFNISLEPGFSATRLTFMRGYNGVYAQASIRGGGEYGVGWRDAGSLQHKQNCFDDFQACAEHLIAAGYCSPSKLTIQGGSNGGLLVAACANQRPDLYACVLGQVGVMDMLRFHKFTIGHAWQSDFGSPDKAKEFEYILPYSPLHNVRVPEGGSRQYPAVLLTTGDHDDRVVPLHSYKLIAELQHTLGGPESAQKNPLIIRIDVSESGLGLSA